MEAGDRRGREMRRESDDEVHFVLLGVLAIGVVWYLPATVIAILGLLW